jgi:hypothetical protein
MNISKRDIKLLLILGGIVIFIICYFSVYGVYNEENMLLAEDIEDAEFELSRLKPQSEEKIDYTELIEQARLFIIAEQAQYPADIRAEDLIMYAVELQNVIGLEEGGLSFIQPTEIMSVQGYVYSDGDDGNGEFRERTAYRTGFSMNCSLSYDQLKDLVHFIYSESPKTSLNSISLSYNPSTGLLYGSLVIHKTFLTEGDYVPKPIPDMPIGLPNPFGVIAVTEPVEVSLDSDEPESSETPAETPAE